MWRVVVNDLNDNFSCVIELSRALGLVAQFYYFIFVYSLIDIIVAPLHIRTLLFDNNHFTPIF